MPNCGFSRMLKAMEEKLSNVVIGEFVKVEAISPEELRAYLQYITNPIGLMWLRASGIKKGPITAVLGSKSDLTFFASRLTTSCKRANIKNRITD